MSASTEPGGHDSLLVNKIVGAVLAAALVVVALYIGIEEFLFPHPHHMPKAYVIDVPEEGSPAPVKEEPDLGLLLLSANADKGERHFKANCTSCHIVSSDNAATRALGPNLWNIVGQKIAADEQWRYSAAMRDFGESQPAWDDQSLFDFLGNPKRYIKGTAMTFAGMKSPEKRADILAYLRRETVSPPPPPAPRNVANAAEAVSEVASESTTAITERVDGAIENVTNAVDQAAEMAEDAAQSVTITGPDPSVSYEIVDEQPGEDAPEQPE